jgi:hypothetical protein
VSGNPVSAELSSLSTALDDVIRRVVAIAEPIAGTADDALASDLFEVERALREANRRLSRARTRTENN